MADTSAEELVRLINDYNARFGASLQASTDNLNEWTTGVKKGRKDILQMGPALKTMKEAIEDSEESLSRMEKGTDEYREAQAKLKTATGQYQDTMKKFVASNVMNGLATAIVQAGSAFIRGSRDMAFTAIQGMQSSMDSIELGAEIFRKEVERTADMARASFEAVAQAGANVPLKLGLAAELAGKAGVELTNQIATLTTKGIDVLSAELTKTKTNFMELSKTGAFFAGGMTEMRNAAGAAGLRLQDYGQVVKNAGDNLRTFGVNQTQAMSMVGKVTAAMGAGVNLQLRNMGYTQAEISEGTAEYMAMLARTGNLAGRSQGDLAKESSGYLSNLRLISAITGEDAKAAQKRAQEASMELGIQTKLNQMGPEAQTKFNNLMAQFPTMGREIKQLFLTGATDNALLLNSPAFEAFKLGISNIADTTVSAKDSIVGVQNSLNSSRQAQMAYNSQFENITAGAAFGQVQGDLVTNANALSGIYVQSARSGQQLSDQLDKQKKTQDGATKEVNNLQVQMEKASIALEKQLTPSLKGFAIQLKGSFTDVEKYIQAALKLMVSIKGVDVLGGGNQPMSSDAELRKQQEEWDKSGFWYKLFNARPGSNTTSSNSGIVVDDENIAAAGGAVLSGPASGYKPNLTMHGTEAIVPLANGGVPVESPVMAELLETLKNAPAGTTINMSPLIEKLSENNQLLRAQVEATRSMRTTLEESNGINKQILQVTR